MTNHKAHPMQFISSLRLTVLCASLVLLVGLVLAVPAPADAAVQSVASWRVTVQGTVSGRPFTQTGTVVMARPVARVGTNNGVNPIEVCLKVGFPAGVPSTGAIWYGTNSACFPFRSANIDMAYVSVSGSTVTARADGRLQATYLNGWTATSSIAANYYSPTGGSATYTLRSNGSLTGSVNLTGRAGANGVSTYRATITGVRTS